MNTTAPRPAQVRADSSSRLPRNLTDQVRDSISTIALDNSLLDVDLVPIARQLLTHDNLDLYVPPHRDVHGFVSWCSYLIVTDRLHGHRCTVENNDMRGFQVYGCTIPDINYGSAINVYDESVDHTYRGLALSDPSAFDAEHPTTRAETERLHAEVVAAVTDTALATTLTMRFADPGKPPYSRPNAGWYRPGTQLHRTLQRII